MEYDDNFSMAWVHSSQDGDLGVGGAWRKEQLINLREILVSQADLRAILAKVEAVQKEVDKLTSGNETLQMYIDNLTVQMAKRR